MLGDLSRVEKIYLRTGYTDMRKQREGLNPEQRGAIREWAPPKPENPGNSL